MLSVWSVKVLLQVLVKEGIIVSGEVGGADPSLRYQSGHGTGSTKDSRPHAGQARPHPLAPQLTWRPKSAHRRAAMQGPISAPTQVDDPQSRFKEGPPGGYGVFSFRTGRQRSAMSALEKNLLTARSHDMQSLLDALRIQRPFLLSIGSAGNAAKTGSEPFQNSRQSALNQPQREG